MLLPRHELETRLESFAPTYDNHYRSCMLRRLGFEGALAHTAAENPLALPDLADPVALTLQLLASWDVGYGAFFAGLADRVRRGGLPSTAEELEPFVPGAPSPERAVWQSWRDTWWAWSRNLGAWDGGEMITLSLRRWNLLDTPIRPVIEQLWESIDQLDDWEPFFNWLSEVREEKDAPHLYLV